MISLEENTTFLMIMKTEHVKNTMKNGQNEANGQLAKGEG